MRKVKYIITILAVIFVFLLIIAGLGYKAYDYTENNPNFCKTCHLMDTAFAKWSQSAHKGINCHECHNPPYIERIKMLVSFLRFHPDKVPPRHGKVIVPFENCSKCHLLREKVAGAARIMGTVGHQKHFFTEGIECTKCHGTKLHEFLPVSGFCKDCHKDMSIHAKVMKEFDCLVCHDFLSKSAVTLIPDRAKCLSCHEQMKIGKSFSKRKDAPMQFECSKCHSPHQKIKPDVSACIECHEDIKDTGLHISDSHGNCMDCHQRHFWKVKDRTVCEKCHKDRKEHNPGTRCDKCHHFRE